MILARILCWLRHDTILIASGTHGAIHCLRCHRDLEVWRLVRPEAQIQAERAHVQAVAKREQLLREINAREPRQPVQPVRRWPRKVG